MTDLETKEHDDESVDGGRHDVNGGRDRTFKANVAYEGGEKALAFGDPVVEGRKVLREAGLEPPDDFVLIELQNPGTRSVGLDEEINLGEPGREEFRAFRADRIYTFTINERGYEWGAAKIGEAELRKVARVAEDDVLILERQDEPDEIIDRGAEVDLDACGTEHIRSEKHPETFEIIVIYNGVTKPLKVSLSELIKSVLGRSIALFGGLPNPHTLSLYNQQGEELPDGKTVKQAKVKKGDRLLLRPSTVKAG
jgi:hypothetical protein